MAAKEVWDGICEDFNGLLWAALPINKMDSIVALLDLQQGSWFVYLLTV